MQRSWRCRAIFALAGLGLLAGCDNAPPPLSPERRAELAETLQPDDARLADLYTQSCRTCHGDPQNTAPLTGDYPAWKPRLDKGIDTLTENAINGFKGMPPLGLCMACDAADFEALIRFMAQSKAYEESQ